MFQILTSHTPYKWLENNGRPSLDDVVKLKLNGTRPYIPEKYKDREKKNPAKRVLYLATKACYQFDPRLRPSAKQIYDYLHYYSGRISSEKYIHIHRPSFGEGHNSFNGTKKIFKDYDSKQIDSKLNPSIGVLP